ncbi:hypothetical protein QBC38DRAFT_258346 [Podospora fimiseda]|uniref:Uncharacterized protein n=1 Tax=Podospora fimiseda TaxID=252190 RepID=A0AAN7BWS9_9PEZI|nr:hypothetical protein QBC38DRAFT_258346 [Podospora fimiseda]
MKNPHHNHKPKIPSPLLQETNFEPQPSPPPETDPAVPQPNLNYGSIPSPPPPSPPSSRILSPDLLRGLLMSLMPLDHLAMSLNAWPHGTALPSGETDSSPIKQWNRPAAYLLRTLTHLCAPGFTFLLGIGVVYFSQSRTTFKQWSTLKLLNHFILRGLVLTLLSELMGLMLSFGKFWVFNIVLISLAVDYVLAGIIWIIMSKTEVSLAFFLLRVLPEKKEDDVSESLLRERTEEEIAEEVAPDRKIIRAGRISWHIHNLLLGVLALVTIWWNIWLSPTGGYCNQEPREKLPESVWARIWFYQVFEGRIMSGFPPLAWVSFAVLGMLYGRIMLASPKRSGKVIALGNLSAGLMFSLIFLATRLFHFGNLSERCLTEMVEGGGNKRNQYLGSAAAFFYLVKYPPDIAFWAFTMAGNHFLLALFSGIPTRIVEESWVLLVLLVFGTSALFFFVVHMFVAIGLGQVVIRLIGHDVGRPDFFSGEPYGVDQLWAFFMTWGLLLGIMYPLCKWYGGFKRSKGPDSIWRFFDL